MVRRVPVPPEQYLINNAPYVEGDFVKNTLLRFSVEQLWKYRLTSKNFKAGIDFFDVYRATLAYNKVTNMVVAHLQKEVAFILNDEVIDQTIDAFMSKPSSAGVLRIRTVNDASITRYVRILSGKLAQAGIPLTLSCAANAISNTMEIRATLNQSQETLYAYKLLFILPDIIKVLKTLTRKARFTNANVKDIARFKLAVKPARTTPRSNGLNTQSPRAANTGSDFVRGTVRNTRAGSTV
jgi:hypothetical protein